MLRELLCNEEEVAHNNPSPLQHGSRMDMRDKEIEISTVLIM
mgnify:CR=1 FL=1